MGVIGEQFDKLARRRSGAPQPAAKAVPEPSTPRSKRRRDFGWALPPEWMLPLLECDLSTARSLHEAKQGSKLVAGVCDILSISADEAIWFGAGGPGSLMFACRMCGLLDHRMSCLEEMLCTLPPPHRCCNLVFQRRLC